LTTPLGKVHDVARFGMNGDSLGENLWISFIAVTRVVAALATTNNSIRFTNWTRRDGYYCQTRKEMMEFDNKIISNLIISKLSGYYFGKLMREGIDLPVMILFDEVIARSERD